MIQSAIVIAIAAAGIASTIAKSKVFEGLREWIYRRSYWLGMLVSCPYCLAHWVCITGCAIYQPRLVYSFSPVVDVILSTFAVIAVSCALAGLLCRLWRWL